MCGSAGGAGFHWKALEPGRYGKMWSGASALHLPGSSWTGDTSLLKGFWHLDPGPVLVLWLWDGGRKFVPGVIGGQNSLLCARFSCTT